VLPAPLSAVQGSGYWRWSLDDAIASCCRRISCTGKSCDRCSTYDFSSPPYKASVRRSQPLHLTIVRCCRISTAHPLAQRAACGAWTLTSSLGTCRWRVQKALLDTSLAFPAICRMRRSRASSGRSGGEYFVRNTATRTLYDSVEEFRKAISSVRERDRGRKSRSDNVTRSFDPAALRAFSGDTRLPMDMIPAMTEFWARHSFPWKQKHRKASDGVSCKRYHAHVESGLIDSEEKRRIRFSNGIDYYMTWWFQRTLDVSFWSSRQATTSRFLFVSIGAWIAAPATCPDLSDEKLEAYLICACHLWGRRRVEDNAFW